MSFGLPSKTHALCAIGHRLVEAGHSVLCASVYRVVQDFWAAKRDLALSVNYASWRIASPKLLLYESGCLS